MRFNKFFDCSFVYQPLRRLLLLNFHDSHEDIVDLFQEMCDNDAENLLKTA